MKNKKGTISQNTALFILVIVVILFISITVVGAIGGYIAYETESTCELGFTDYLCWRWSKVDVFMVGNN